MAEPAQIEVKVKVAISAEAAERLAAAQEKFNARLRDLQAALSELQMATYGLAEDMVTQVTDAPTTEGTPAE